MALSLRAARDLLRARNPDLHGHFEVVNVIAQPSGGHEIKVRWWDGTEVRIYLTAAESGGISNEEG